jgi:hypothetical protein
MAAGLKITMDVVIQPLGFSLHNVSEKRREKQPDKSQGKPGSEYRYQ